MAAAVLVHDLGAHADERRIGEEGALHSGERLVRAALRVVGEEGGVEDWRADWSGSRELLRVSSQTEGTRAELRHTVRSAAQKEETQGGVRYWRAGVRRAGRLAGDGMGLEAGLHKGQAGCGVAVQVARQLL